jgi:hypothetical protein
MRTEHEGFAAGGAKGSRKTPRKGRESNRMRVTALVFAGDAPTWAGGFGPAAGWYGGSTGRMSPMSAQALPYYRIDGGGQARMGYAEWKIFFLYLVPACVRVWIFDLWYCGIWQPEASFCCWGSNHLRVCQRVRPSGASEGT